MNTKNCLTLPKLWGGWDASGIYDGEYTYDERGNILTLKRKGRMTGDSCYVTGVIDDLEYEYLSNSNCLNKVTESASMDWGFKNPSSNTTPYEYDDNGSKTEDHYKGIVTVYNHLTLPVVISKGTDSILMMYDAGGTLLRKQHKSGSTVVMTRDYIGGIEYVNDTLDAIYHSEGRIKYIDEVGRYEYYIRDHLGNIRITYSDLNADGLITTPDEILEEMHYYSFGMMMEGAWMGSSGQYGYNGIEYESFLDLEMNLATYRGLDPTLGRWWQVDPYAESLYSMSPYQAMGNNPILYSDPDGDFIPQLVGGIVGGGLNIINNWDKILKNPISALGYAATGIGAGVVATLPGGIVASRAILAGGNVATDIASGNMPRFENFGDVANYAGGTALDAFSTAGASKALGQIAKTSLNNAALKAGKEIAEEGALSLLSSTELGEMTLQWYGQEVGTGVTVEITDKAINWGARASGYLGVNSVNTSFGIANGPQLPDKTIVNQNGVKIEHYYKSGDHGPAHAHVIGKGSETRIGPNGHPILNDKPMTPDQRKVYNANKGKVRRKINKIGKWLSKQLK